MPQRKNISGDIKVQNRERGCKPSGICKWPIIGKLGQEGGLPFQVCMINERILF